MVTLYTGWLCGRYQCDRSTSRCLNIEWTMTIRSYWYSRGCNVSFYFRQVCIIKRYALNKRFLNKQLILVFLLVFVMVIDIYLLHKRVGHNSYTDNKLTVFRLHFISGKGFSWKWTLYCTFRTTSCIYTGILYRQREKSQCLNLSTEVYTY